MLNDFHFLQPEWFLALLPLALLLWALRRPSSGANAWREVVDARLLPLLLVEQGANSRRWPLWLLGIAWLVAVLALADPVWEKQPRPVFQTREARVIVLDLSRSMDTQDLKPSRLVRARYKVEDILRQSDEGQIGLVAFAGDAFVVSPLTRDADTIASLLKALDPGIMPVQGSRADLGLEKAGDLLRQAGLDRGEVLLIADSSGGERAVAAAADLRKQGYRVSALGVGTASGAPLPNGRGGFQRDASGNLVVPDLDTEALRKVAAAGGGAYAGLADNDTDLAKVLLASANPLNDAVEATDRQTDLWKPRGPWLVLLLLPLAALAFRRGWLLSVAFVMAGTLSTPDPAMADGWDDLWQRRDQQAALALEAGDTQQAAELAESPTRHGTAEYLNGNFERALADFDAAPGADGAYNKGNTLARLGRYQEAIAAYDQALAQQPDMEDAEFNRKLVADLLEQQQQQNPSQQQQEGQQDPQSGKSEQNAQQGQDPQSDDASEQSAQQQPGSDSQPSDQQGSDPSQQSAGNEQQNPESQAGDGSQENQEQQSAGQPQDNPQDGSQDSRENPFAEAAEKAGQPEQAPSSKNQAGNTGKESAPEGQPRAPRQAADTESQPREPAGQSEEQAGDALAQADADPLSNEERLAAEQWLRRIPDDPGGLLRRKFLYQYQQRATRSGVGGGQPW